MTDDPRRPPGDGEDRDPVPQAHPADDVTPSEAQQLEALFGDVVAEEPPTTVTPLTVLSATQRSARSSGRSAGQSAGRTARRLRIGILAAALVAVAGTGTVLLIRADPGDTAAMTRTSAAATTAAASSGVAGSSAAPGSSVAATTTAAGSMSESGSMAPSPASSDASTSASIGASSAASSSAAGSGSSTAGPVPDRCALTAAADLPRVRATVLGTVLQDARISLCRDPTSLPSSTGSLLVNIRTSRNASCASASPVCRPVAGQSDAYTSSSAEGFWIWVYGRGYEVAVFRDTRPSGGEIDATVATARPLLIAVS
ncbi:hypothetical protein ABLG96_20805 [Nakamurella sp. A5-74]|uniref:Uncharacterized protein n=1 Tax=Nakamurella sp. A5-74 TaxID=3158264 RepID=A0AAU8DPK6_9ACTN